MFGRVSPKFSLIQVVATKKKSSPRIGGTKKKGASPKANRPRANWNPGLEKALVELLLEHNNECYRGQNGWSSESWNRIARLFHEKFPHTSFSRVQIQDKEKELKRDYKMLKEARKQSGVSWDEHACKIVAEQPIWDNIILSIPKARKFQTKGFPLFDALGELYDGQTAEGTMNFTSLEPTQNEPSVTQNRPTLGAQDYSSTDFNDDDELRILHQPDHRSASTFSRRPTGKGATTQSDDGDEDDLRILQQPDTISTSSTRPIGTSRKGAATRRDDVGKVVQKRKRNDDVADKMDKYLELKTKQVEEEFKTKQVEEELKTKKAEEENDFSIKNCNALLSTLEGLSSEERAEAYDVFKDVQNREIFITAEPSSRLIWLRKKITLERMIV